MRKRLEFLSQGFKKATDVGSIFPASPALGRELSRHVSRDRPSRVLEIGVGTGPVTEEIIRALQPGSFIQLVEMNPVFCQTLRDRFLSEPIEGLTVELFEGPIQNLVIAEPYDVVVSSLPHNNFGAAMLAEIFARYQAALRPGGVFSFYEYVGVRRLRSLWVGPGRRARWGEVEAFFETSIEPATFESRLVMGNLPPAVVHHLFGRKSK